MFGIRSFWGALPTEGRWLLSTVAFQTLGRGLTLPFTIIYLHEVRGFDLDLAGTLMGLIAVTGLVVTGPFGTWVDRFGARAVLVPCLLSMIAGNVLLAYATEPAVAAVGLILIGINFGGSWPAFNALIAAIVEGDLRQRYFGVNFALVNLGIGVGGIVGGFYVDVGRPSTFTAIFLADAATTLIPLALLLGPLRHVRSHGHPDDAPEAGPPPSYRRLLANPAVLWLTGLTFLAVFVGYGQLEAGFPGFSRTVAEVSTRTIGFAFAANTAVIVALQFWVLGRIAGRRRTRVMTVMVAVWVGAWLLLGSAGLVPGTLVAGVAVVGFAGVFAFGETMMQPTIPAICNDLATDRTRGRANAINAAAFQCGAIAGPVAAGWLLDRRWDSAYITLMVLGCLGIVAMARALERRISPQVNGVTAEEPAPNLQL